MIDIEKIRKNLLRYVSLGEPELESFCRLLSYKKLARGAHLYTEGQTCRAVAFIAQGSLRYYYLTDGSEQTGQFFFENGWYTDYLSFLSGKPSEQYIQAMEATELYLMSKTDLYALYDEFPRLERFGRIMAENAYLGSRINHHKMLTMSPEERYLKLVQERPLVMERVPLKYVASYLGIQPESLSRIRKRLYDKRGNE